MFFTFLDAISAANPRVIDDSRARKLSNDLKRCTYYETCSTYGLNVERVFQDGERGAKKVVMVMVYRVYRVLFWLDIGYKGQVVIDAELIKIITETKAMMLF